MHDSEFPELLLSLVYLSNTKLVKCILYIDHLHPAFLIVHPHDIVGAWINLKFFLYCVIRFLPFREMLGIAQKKKIAHIVFRGGLREIRILPLCIAQHNAFLLSNEISMVEVVAH